MNRLIAMSLTLVYLALPSLPANANERGNGDNGRSAAPPAQRGVPAQQPAPRQTFQQPAQSYQRPSYQPQANSFEAHASVPLPMFRSQPNVGPTYRTAPAFRSSAPTSWNARSAQNRDSGGIDNPNVGWNARFPHGGNAGNGGGPISWQQRFHHRPGNSYWRHYGGGDHWNNNPSDGNLPPPNYTVPILAVVASAVVAGLTDNRPESTTVVNNIDVDAAPAPAALVEVASAPDEPQPYSDPVAAPLHTHAPYFAPPDLPPYDPGPVTVHTGNAPADEYFGSMHMSVLGIRNSINDTNVGAPGAGEERGHGLLHNLFYTEESFRDWQHQYPNDSWIIVNGYELVDDFAKLDAETPNENPHVASVHGIDLGNWLDATYPGNQYASK